MSWKIAIIGGGSVLWMPRLGCDMFMEPGLDGSQLVLVDIDKPAAELCRDYLQDCVKRLNKHWTISIASEEDALKGADVVVVSISTGGFESMDCDYTIPEKYGVYHSVSDTTGPGGIFRTLRNAPVFLGIAERMARLCPDAWMVHVTNPLSQITRIVNAQGLVRCCGLCHEVPNAMRKLRDFFGVSDPNDLDTVFVGVNHFTLITELYVKGVKDPLKMLTPENYFKYREHCEGGSTGTVDDRVLKDIPKEYSLYFNFFIAELTGCYPAAETPHIVENFPRFLNEKSLIQKFDLPRKGVMPMRPENKKKLAETMFKTLKDGSVPPEINNRSAEMLADVLVGILTGEPRRIVATLPNVGQVSNLPLHRSVETWAIASRSGIHPVHSGEVPLSCLGFMNSVAAEQELACQAALKRDRDLVRQALFASPLLHEKEHADELMQDLFEAEKEWINW